MIGVFDSGLGGLSVLAAIARTLPQADLLYLADTGHVPYGSKSEAFIQGRVLAIGDHLVEQGCTLIVVACNTATAAAISALRQRHPGIPVVGVEPGVKPAAASSKSRHIAVLATEITARSERLRQLIRDHAGQVRVQVEPCPGWATRVEMLELSRDEFAAEVEAKVAPLLQAGVDRVVLGCTHYSFIKPLLAPLLANRAEVVDVADAVARQVVRLAGDNTTGQAGLTLLATARPERLQAALPQLHLHWLAQRSQQAAQLVRV